MIAPLRAARFRVDIARQTDAAAINAVLNHPTVYPWIKGPHEGPFDLATLMADDRCIVLMGLHGGVTLWRHQPGIYEVHTAVLPPGRGSWALAMCREVAWWAFTHTDAVELLTEVPVGNGAAKAMTRMCGGELDFVTRAIWPEESGMVPVEVYSLTIQRWARECPWLIIGGARFHRMLEKHGIDTDHEDDDTHDRYVGAACDMIGAGQAAKAVSFYNRWAAMADYGPIRMVGTDPLRIDIGTVVLRITGSEWEIDDADRRT